MTPEQKPDRLERMVRLLYERILRDSRDARKQTAKWKAYFAADREHEAAKLAAAENPKDLDTSETLRRAAESLKQAREELRLSIENR
jgi:uncharacterized membrane protein YccC